MRVCTQTTQCVPKRQTRVCAPVHILLMYVNKRMPNILSSLKHVASQSSPSVPRTHAWKSCAAHVSSIFSSPWPRRASTRPQGLKKSPGPQKDPRASKRSQGPQKGPRASKRPKGLKKAQGPQKDPRASKSPKGLKKGQGLNKTPGPEQDPRASKRP